MFGYVCLERTNVRIFVTDIQTNNAKDMKTDNKYNLVKHLISQADVFGDEDEARLSYKNSQYHITGWLSGEDFEYEFIVDGDSEELEEPEQELIFKVLEKEIENERINASYNVYEEPYFYATHNQ